MPARESAPIGAPCWVDLMSSDVPRSRAFYGDLFGWTSEEPDPDLGGYWNFFKDGVLVAGGMSAQDPQMPDVWSIHLATEDASKTLELAAANGGQVYVPAMEVVKEGTSLGTMGVAGDPGGAAIGMWQPGEHKGFGIFNEPGAPSWFELHTRDYAAAVPFYRDVFHWETQVEADTPEFRYTTMVNDGVQYAGIMDASGFLLEGIPAHWSVYFGAADTDAALARAVELGGAIVMSPEDTPYGRLAVATDPTGAQFKLHGPNKAA